MDTASSDDDYIPYRTDNKDQYNQLYAAGVKKSFQYLTPELQYGFEIFTDNLMQEEYISRDLLIEAIKDFYEIYQMNCEVNYNWTRFTNYVWNFQPMGASAAKQAQAPHCG
jgi:hypothetical protein